MAVQSTVAARGDGGADQPPIRACDDEEGSPKYQVVRFHAIAPSRPAAMITTSPWSPLGGVITSLTVLATSCPRNAPAKFMTAARMSATARCQRPGRDRGRDRVGGVVESVRVVEAQRDDDDGDDER